nr:zinc ribbon domain-containing protein [Clostridia bacterium]
MTPEMCESIRLENMERFGFGPNVMKKIKVCTNCGKPLGKQYTFCSSCGSHMPKDTLFQLYRSMHKSCQKCETVVPEWMIFCPNCGTRIKNA